MSLVIPAVINGVTRHIAMYEINDQPQPYFHELLAFGPVKMAGSKRTGGFFKPQFGSAEIMAGAFSDVMPPDSVTLPAHLRTCNGDILIGDLTGQLTSLDFFSAQYDLYSQEHETTTDVGDTDTFLNYFIWACDSTRLNLTLDSSLATDFDITFTLTNDKPIIQILDEMAESLNHFFTIKNNVLILVDMATDNGTDQELETGFDFFDDETVYEAPTPYSLFTALTYSVSGTFPHGDEYNQSTVYEVDVQADIEAQLERKKTLLNKWWITFSMPIGDNVIQPGQKVSFTDHSKFIPIRVTMNARTFNYNLETYKEKLIISGEGILSKTHEKLG